MWQLADKARPWCQPSIARYFSSAERNRVVVNIGGISNISILGGQGETTGFDTGPSNVLLDGWIQSQQGLAYDAAGAWAAQRRGSDKFIAELIGGHSLRCHHRKAQDVIYSACSGCISTCKPAQAWLPSMCKQRWLDRRSSIADAIQQYSDGVREVYVCGSGAYNLVAGAFRPAFTAIQKLPVVAELGVFT